MITKNDDHRNFEIEVLYLDEKSWYKSRKTVRYDTSQEALKIFNQAYAKMTAEGRKTVVAMRERMGEEWHLLNSHQT